MHERTKRIASLGAASLIGAALTAFVHAGATTNGPRSIHEDVASPSICDPTAGAFGSDFAPKTANIIRRMHEAMGTASSGDVDRDFLRMMIPHHQGAIDMALVLLEYGRDKRLLRLAQSLIVEQGQEIAYMRHLLDTSSGAKVTAQGADP
jgi:Domain of unknown function (DUF305)